MPLEALEATSYETMMETYAMLVGAAFVSIGIYFALVVRRRDLAGYSWMYFTAGATLIAISIQYTIAAEVLELILRFLFYSSALLIGWNLFGWILAEYDVATPTTRFREFRDEGLARWSRRVRRVRAKRTNEEGESQSHGPAAPAPDRDTTPTAPIEGEAPARGDGE